MKELKEMCVALCTLSTTDSEITELKEALKPQGI